MEWYNEIRHRIQISGRKILISKSFSTNLMRHVHIRTLKGNDKNC